MGLSPGNIALGLVIGAGVGLLAGRTLCTPESSPASDATAVDRGPSVAIEKQLGDLAAQLARIESAVTAAPSVSREAIPRGDEKRPDLGPELARLHSEIDRMSAIGPSATPIHATLETILEREVDPQDWKELAKLEIESNRNRIKFKTEDEVLRCLGKPDSIGCDSGRVFWMYHRSLPGIGKTESVCVTLANGRVSDVSSTTY